MLSKAPWRGTEDNKMTTSPSLQQPGLTATSKVAELPLWEPHGRFPNPTEGHLQKQGNCGSVPFPIWRDSLTVDNREGWFKASHLSLARASLFKPGKGIICVTSLDSIHLVMHTHIHLHMLPKKLLFQALESQTYFYLSLPVLQPGSACWQKALPWKAKFAGCHGKAPRNHLGTTNKKLMLPSK